MKQKANFILRKAGKNNILVPVGRQVSDHNGIIVLNDSATYLWELLTEERSIDELSFALVQRFNVSYEVAMNDILAFLDEMFKIDLIDA